MVRVQTMLGSCGGDVAGGTCRLSPTFSSARFYQRGFYRPNGVQYAKCCDGLSRGTLENRKSAADKLYLRTRSGGFSGGELGARSGV